MQQRRREQIGDQHRTQASILLPPEHWQTLRQRNPKILEHLCAHGSGKKEWRLFRLLNRIVRINPLRERVEEQVKEQGNSLWRPAGPLASQVAVFYLVQAERVCMSGNWLPEHQLECGYFFRGIHQLPVDRLLARFGNDSNAFLYRSKQLGGTVIQDLGDAAVLIWALPQVPVKLILWCSDDELPASLTVLFDSSIEQMLAADAIWTMFRLLVERLLEEE